MASCAQKYRWQSTESKESILNSLADRREWEWKRERSWEHGYRCATPCWARPDSACRQSYRMTATTTIYTHTRSTALCPRLHGWAGTRKVKPIWILLNQETVSGSGISWAVCKSAPCSRQITMPAPHCSVFLQAGCPSCRPTNSVKALKAK